MEIERKFLVKEVPFDVTEYRYHDIEQAYLTRNPVVRIRKQDNEYYLTYKNNTSSKIAREEYNLPLTEESYNELLPKAGGIILTKRRYLIPYEKYTIELDVFSGKYNGLVLAEVEFETEEDALGFKPPEWFGRDVSYTGEYQNSRLSMEGYELPKI